VGKGYSKAFTDNMTAIINRINQGENTVKITEGPDDICKVNLSESPETCHCAEQKITQSDERALSDLKQHFDKNINYGQIIDLTPDVIFSLRSAFIAGTIRSACEGCEWINLCNKVSGNSYSDTVLWDSRQSSEFSI